MKILLLLLLLSCASWAPTREAVLRRQAASKLKTCVQYRCQFTKQCIKESVEWCKANGLEASCGTDGITPDDPIMCSHGVRH